MKRNVKSKKKHEQRRHSDQERGMNLFEANEERRKAEIQADERKTQRKETRKSTNICKNYR